MPRRKNYIGPLDKKKSLIQEFNLDFEKIVNSSIEQFREMIKHLNLKEIEICEKIRKSEKNRRASANYKERQKEKFILLYNEKSRKKSYLDSIERALDEEDRVLTKQIQIDEFEMINLYNKNLADRNLHRNNYAIVKSGYNPYTRTENLTIVVKNSNDEPINSLLNDVAKLTL